MTQAPAQGAFNAPFWPWFAVLIAPIANHAVRVIGAGKRAEVSRNVDQRHGAVVHDAQSISRPVVGFDDTALGQSIPVNVHVFRPMVEFSEMAHLFGFNEFTGTVFVLHQREKGVTVLDASFELELAVIACLGFVKDVPRVDATWKQLGHRITV